MKPQIYIIDRNVVFRNRQFYAGAAIITSTEPGPPWRRWDGVNPKQPAPMDLDEWTANVFGDAARHQEG